MTLLIGQPQRGKGRCSRDKASVHGTPALPTELMDANFYVNFLTTIFRKSEKTCAVLSLNLMLHDATVNIRPFYIFCL